MPVGLLLDSAGPPKQEGGQGLEYHICCAVSSSTLPYSSLKDITADFIGGLGRDYPDRQTPSLQTDFV